MKSWNVDEYERSCTNVSLSGVTRVVGGGACTANRNSPDLRYIYTY
jgi:hypothetical protein